MEKERRITCIAVLGADTRVIGRAGKLPWHIPEDLQRFKERTTGHTVIMGRKTWESLPERFRPLPGRTNIVVTRNAGYKAPGASVAHSLEQAFGVAARAPGSDEVFVIGGGELYRAALPSTTHLYLTLVDSDEAGDATFPEYDKLFPNVLREKTREHDGLFYRFLDLSRA